MESKSDANTSSDLWDKALAYLDEEDREQLRAEAGSGITDLEKVIKLVETKRNDCVKKQWVLYTNSQGDSVYVRDVITRVSDWIVKFQAVGDAAVQYDPGHASLPWAAVRMLLQLTVNDCQTFGAMLESIESVSRIVARYTSLESRVLIRISDRTKQLCAALVSLYAASLRFILHCYRYFAKSTFKRTLKSTFHTANSFVGEPFREVERLEGEVFKLSLLVESEVTGSQLEDIRSVLSTLKQDETNLKASTEARRKRLASLINGIDTRNTYENALQYHHAGTCDWALQLQAFHDWQSSATARSSLLWIHGPAGFGKTFMSVWIVHHLKESIQGPLAYYFCVADNQATRDPYAILRSWLVQVLEQDDAAVRAMSSLLTVDDKEQNLTYRDLWELFIAIGDAIPGIVFILDGFDECTAIDGGAHYHRNEPRNQFLRDLVKGLEKTRVRILVVSRDVQDIREVLGKSNIEDKDMESFEYQITAEDTTEDIRSFSEFMVNERIPKKKADLRQRIANQAADRSQGMFLWVKLLQQGISPGQNARELAITVQEMPSGIGEAYSRELEKISQLPEKHKRAAQTILRWVLYSVRPLLVKELAEALVVSDDELDEYPDEEMFPDAWQNGFVDEEYVSEVLLGRCGSLLQLRKKSANTPLADQTIHVVHFSVKEYIANLRTEGVNDQLASSLGLSDGISEEVWLSNICLRYLRLDIFDEVPPTTTMYPLLSYASWAWYFHSFYNKPTPPSNDIIKRTQNAFDPTASSWKVWTPVMEARFNNPKDDEENDEEDEDEDGDSDDIDGATLTTDTESRLNNKCRDDEVELDGDSSDSSVDASEQEIGTSLDTAEQSDKLLATVQNPIYFASLLGLLDVVQWLEDQGLDPNCKGGQFGFPLQAAVAKCQTTVVKHFIDRKVDVSLAGGLYGSAVNAAAALSPPEMLDTLLTAGATVNATNEAGWTGLHYAAHRGATDIAKLLLKSGANIDAVNSSNDTPLLLACYFGFEDVAQLLLSYNADMNIPDNDGILPFRYALELEHDNIALLLMDHIPEEQTHILDEGKYLHSAARNGSVAAVQRLLDRKVDVNQLDVNSWTALHFACALDHQDIVEALIGAGADVSCSHLESPTPSALAAASNNIQIIQTLHQNHANLDSGKHPAMWQSVKGGHLHATKTLLELRASLRFTDEDTQQTLYDLACEEGDQGMAELLVYWGCFQALTTATGATSQETRASTTNGESLRLMVFNDKRDAVAELFSSAHGVPNAAVLNEALCIAAARGFEQLTLLLLAHGASLNTQDINGRTALHHASSQMHVAIADLLISRGANPLIEDNIGSTPLDLAVTHGMLASDFIQRHMDDLTTSISRRESLLGAIGTMSIRAAPPAIRRGIAGTWTGFYEYLSWEKGTHDPFSISIPEADPDDPREVTFTSELEHDPVGSFRFYGFVDALGVVWFVKLYEKHGWLYRGQLDSEGLCMKGTWGSNRKLWYGTFKLGLSAQQTL